MNRKKNITTRDKLDAITQKDFMELFNYNAATGKFKRVKKATRGQRKKIGWIDPKGYHRIQIGDITYATHHLAWLYCFGYLPEQLDHKNRIKTDNRICNLEETNTLDNCKNQGMPRNNTSGQVGVTWCKTRKLWRARIGLEMGRVHLGWHKTYSAAVDARKNAEVLYGYSETHGA